MKKDELNNLNINNEDGQYRASEDSLKNIKEIQNTPEIAKEEQEIFQASEENKIKEEFEKQSFDNANNSEGDGGASSTSGSASAAAGGASAVAAVGGVVAVVAISAVFVLGVVKLPVIPAVDVHLLLASSTSLAFSLNTNIENHEELTITLQGAGYQVTTPFQEYVKFVDLQKNEIYKLIVLQNGESSRYSSNFYTNEKEDPNNISITVTSYIDDKLFFHFEDSLPGEKLYTVTVKNKKGDVIFVEDTVTPKEYEIDNFVEDVAIFVAINGTITAGTQVFKPLYDYENINWVWGEYGETVTAIIPSTNGTADYYVRDIRNFEIDRQDPTCTEDGFVIRQAAFIGPDKNRYESQKEFTLPAAGHDFSDVTYTWSNHYNTCSAEAICPVCGVKIEESVEAVVTNVEENDISYTKYTATFENENFSTRRHFEDLTYGSYPQSKENDTSITSSLDAQYGTPISDVDKWTSYEYYANSELANYMYYVDVDSDSDNQYDYRGVYFTSYRPISTTDELGNSSYQYDNGYQTNTTYWFKYEPIQWDVLHVDEDKLFITSRIVLDSQSYYHEMNDQQFVHNGKNGYANNYELSDIRNWLNDAFYNSAFKANEQIILTSEVDNSLESTLDNTNAYVSDNTNDKMFLLSRSEINDYLSNNELSITASDYAKSQGLYVALSDNNAFWALRTPYPSQSYQIRYVTNTSSVTYDSIDKTSLGVRPACYIDIK